MSYGPSGNLEYEVDDEGNRIPDFSYAGYGYGETDPPFIPEAVHLDPMAGDNTGAIQDAIDQVAGMPLDADGFRGAVVLGPGTYKVSGTIRVNASGVVLRGSGDGSDPDHDSILQATGNSPDHRDVIVVGGKGFPGWEGAEVDGTRTDVTSDVVVLNAREVKVASASSLHVGDTVILVHPVTDAWLAVVGEGGASVPWSTGDRQNDIVYNRTITAIDGNTLTLDVPVYNPLVRQQSQSYLYKLDRSKLATHVGVEKLRVDIQSSSSTDEDHAWNAIHVSGAEDAWVLDATTMHFGFAGVEVGSSTRVTICRTKAIDPSAIVEPGKLYNFTADHHAQQVLFADCAASKGRHHFVSNGTASVSGIVFLRCTSSDINASSEGHRRWSQALLYDSIVETSPNVAMVIGAYNRGDYGTQHGWAAVNSVIWRHDTAGKQALVQKPPTAQNYAIGVIGESTGDGPFDGPAGYIEQGEGTLVPSSLYEAQLCDRLAR